RGGLAGKAGRSRGRSGRTGSLKTIAGQTSGPPVRGRAYLTVSLRLFKAWALTTLRAGLALTVIISPGLNGLGMVRALVAGLVTPLILSSPGNVKIPGPFLPRSALTRLTNSSTTAATCLRESPVLAANAW